ncbi:unnamed protein product [Peniophora sp. CBMAI 1063]|nr:unnamed protein product [Peniophora sp. CBMAI 1063]
MPGLWASFNNNMIMAAAQGFLARSGNQELTLSWDRVRIRPIRDSDENVLQYGSNDSWAVLRLLCGEAHLRVGYLSIPLMMMDRPKSQQVLAAHPLRNLHTLHLACGDSNYASDPFATLQPEALRELSVIGFIQRMDWRRAVQWLCHLRTMTLNFDRIWSLAAEYSGLPAAMSSSQAIELLSAIAEIASLESLRMLNLPEDMGVEGLDASKFTLTACRNVELSGDEDAVGALLGALALHPEVRLRVNIRLREPDTAPSRSLACSAILAHLSRVDAPLSSVLFEHTSDQPVFGLLPARNHSTVNPRWKLEAHRSERPDEGSAPNLTVSFQSSSRTGDGRAWDTLSSEDGELARIVNAMGNGTVALHLSAEDGDAARVTQDVLRQRLKGWTKVEHLYVSGAELKGVVISELSNGSRSERGILFPRLQILTLVNDGLDAKRAAASTVEGYEIRGGSLWIPKLIHMLQKRSSAGVPIQYLQVPSHLERTQTEAWYRDLVSLVDVVTF